MKLSFEELQDKFLALGDNKPALTELVDWLASNGWSEDEFMEVCRAVLRDTSIEDRANVQEQNRQFRSQKRKMKEEKYKKKKCKSCITLY